jgi:hypothetical protein
MPSWVLIASSVARFLFLLMFVSICLFLFFMPKRHTRGTTFCIEVAECGAATINADNLTYVLSKAVTRHMIYPFGKRNLPSLVRLS